MPIARSFMARPDLALLICVILAAVAPVAAEHPDPCSHPETEQPRVERPPVVPGQSLNVEGLNYVVQTGSRPAQEPGTSLLSIDVYVRPIHPISGEPRIGLWVPGMQVAYRLSNATVGGIASGELGLRLTQDGPAYGATLPMRDEVLEQVVLSVELEFSV